MSFTDDFNRADSSTVGNGWIEVDPSVWAISGNKLRGVGNGPESYDQFCFAPASGNVDDGVVSVDFNASVSGAFPQLGFRLTDGATLTGYTCYVNESNGRFGYGTINNGTYTELAGNTLGAGVINPGTNYRFTSTLSGASISIQLYDIDADVVRSTINDTDSTYSGTGTGVTLNNSGAGQVDFDNFSAIPDSSLSVDSVTTSSADDTGTAEVTGTDLTTATINSFTFSGINCSGVSAADANTLNFTMITGGAQLGVSHNFVLTADSVASTPLSATFNPPTGMQFGDLTVGYASLHPQSFLVLAGLTDLAAGDQVVLDLVDDQGGDITFDPTTGLVSTTTPASVTKSFDYYIQDASDGYSRGLTGTWTILAEPTPGSGEETNFTSWIRSLGYSDQVNDDFHLFMDSQGIPKGAFNDRFMAYLGGLGYTGTLSDRIKAWNYGE
jgi:hypothetical protein